MNGLFGLELVQDVFRGEKAWYRLGTSDEDALREVVDRRVYRRASIKFDVELGENWLDLGANIGAFAVYCRHRRAVAECYEPEPGNFAVLQRNADVSFKTAVSASRDKQLRFWVSRKVGSFQRGTLSGVGVSAPPVPNIYAGEFVSRSFDGIKMDIEGSELKDHYRYVQYPPEYDRRMADGGVSKTFFDRFIFCWGLK